MISNLWKFITKYSVVEIGAFIALIGTVVTLVNEKGRDFIFRKVSFNKSKAQIENDTAIAHDSTLDTMLKRITALSNDFLALSSINIHTQKKNNELELKILKLENEINNIKQLLKNTCKLNCITFDNDTHD